MPEVNALVRFRQQHLGRRDGFAWCFGFLGVALGLSGLLIIRGAVVERRLLEPLLLAVPWSVALLAWFFRKPWARPAVLVLAGGTLVLTWVVSRGSDLAVGFALLLLAPVLVAWFSVPSQLSFGLLVSDDDLRRVLHAAQGNPLARSAFATSLLGLLLPPFLLLVPPMAIVALRRVNRAAIPPVGGRPRAIAALAVTGAGVIWWLAFFRVLFVPPEG